MAKIKVAFYLDNRLIPNVNLSEPELGNPGCGGTEFLFVALPFYLKKYSSSIIPVLYAHYTEHLPKNIETHRVQSVIEAAKKSSEHSSDIFIYRPYRKTEHEVIDLLDKLNLKTIAWAHITPLSSVLRKMSKSKSIKSIVYVEHEQYDLSQDSAMLNRSHYIVNGFDVNTCGSDLKSIKSPKTVVYIGALVEQKGFHKLARLWPQILERVPEAKLNVIGSGKLYSEFDEFGDLKIASRKYEDFFIKPYLVSDTGEVLPSVTFLGQLGTEKFEILRTAIVGVPNPTGSTENCPGSALEIQACETAVVTGAFYGLLDTVSENKSGYLCSTDDEFVSKICYLLNNQDIAMEMGQSGKRFVESRYSWIKVVKEWEEYLENIQSDTPIKRKRFKRNIFKHHKFLVIINRFIRILLLNPPRWPTVVDVKIYLYSLYNRIK